MLSVVTFGLSALCLTESHLFDCAAETEWSSVMTVKRLFTFTLLLCVFLRRMRSKFGEIHRKSMRSEAQTWFEEKGEKLKCQRLSWTHTQKHCHCRRPLLTLHSWHIRWTFAWHIFRQSLTVTLNSNCTVTSKSGVVLANTDGKGWEKSQNPSRERWKSLLSLSRFLLWTLQAPHFFAHWSLSTKQTAGAQ